MGIALSEAKAQLTELAPRAESGKETMLTRHGAPAVRLRDFAMTDVLRAQDARP